PAFPTANRRCSTPAVAARRTAPAISPVPTASARWMPRKSPCAVPSASAWRASPASCRRRSMAKARKPLPSLEWLQPRLRLTRALALLSYLGLMALLAVSTWLDDLPQQARLSLLALQLVPLAILLPGIVLGHARGH